MKFPTQVSCLFWDTYSWSLGIAQAKGAKTLTVVIGRSSVLFRVPKEVDHYLKQHIVSRRRQMLENSFLSYIILAAGAVLNAPEPYLWLT